MADDRVISTVDALCRYHECQHTFQLFVSRKCAFFQKLLVSLVSPDKRSLLVAVTPPSY